MPHYPHLFPCRYCNINQSIWLAVLHPTMTQSVRITVWERKGTILSSNRLIATTQLLKLSRVRSYPEKFRKTQLPFYGAPVSMYGSTSHPVKLMNTQPHANASHYRGRLTVTLEEKEGKKKDGSSRAQKNKMKLIKGEAKRGAKRRADNVSVENKSHAKCMVS